MWNLFILMHVKVKLLVPQSCLTLCSPWAAAPRLLCPCASPGKNTGVGAISFSRGSSWPRDQTWVSCIAGGFFTAWINQGSLLMHVALVCLLSLLYDTSFCEYTIIYLPFDDLLVCFQFLTLVPRNRMNVFIRSTLYKSSTFEHSWEFL